MKRITVFQNETHRLAVESLRGAAKLRDSAEKACRAFVKTRSRTAATQAMGALALWLAKRGQMRAYSKARKEADE